MIIVAGYLNFTADQSAITLTGNAKGTNEGAPEETMTEEYVDVAVDPEENMEDLESVETAGGGETLGIALAEGETEDETIADVENIGEAVLTSAIAQNFSASAKLSREQSRSQSKETLMDVINNGSVTEEMRQEAMNSLMALSDMAEKELAAETMLEAKGFANSVVSINDTGIDVVVCLESLTDSQKAQIEDIVKRQAGVEADQIVITTLK